LAPALRSLGWETTVLIPTSRNAAERLRAAGIRRWRLRSGAARDRRPRRHLRFFGGFPREVGLIRSLIRERQIDLVLLGGLVNPHGAIAGRLERIPVVWQILDTLAPRMLRLALMPLVTRLAGAVMCTGEAVARAHPAAGLGSAWCSSSLPSTWSCSVEIRRCGRGRAASWGWARTSPSCTVGNLTPMKDHDTLVRAAAELHRMHPRTRFVILDRATSTAAGTRTRFFGPGRNWFAARPELIIRDPANGLQSSLRRSTSSGSRRGPVRGTADGGRGGDGSRSSRGGDRVGSVPEAVGGEACSCRRAIRGAGRRGCALIERPSARAAIGQEGHRWASERFSVEASADAHIRAFEIACARASRGT
jgi:glycosyltransferase involved in cell wall biosynthesis